MSSIDFNPLTGEFDLVTPPDKMFKPFTHFNCGPLSELDLNWFNKISAGQLPLVDQVRKIDLGELSNVGSD